MCGDLGILSSSSCNQRFEMQVEESNGVPDALADEMRKRIMEHYRVSHPEFNSKIDKLDAAYVKDTMKNKSSFKEVSDY